MSFQVGDVTHQWSVRSGLVTHFADSMTSTNQMAKADAPVTGISLWVCNQQSEGRGRGTNSWSAPAGDTLLSSWVFPLPKAPQPVTTPLVGLALYRAAVATWNYLPWALKAPNDLYLNDKKVAGLLLETVQQGSEYTLIVGLGLNVFSSPDLGTTTHINAHCHSSDALSERAWTEFLDRFLLELTLSIGAMKGSLTSHDSDSLLVALNALPLLQEKYTSILPDAGLKTSQKTIRWQDL